MPRGGTGVFTLFFWGNHPTSNLPAVTHALDAQALAINPQIAPHRRAHRVQNILPFVAILIAEDSIGEFLSVARGPAIVDVQCGPSPSGVDLIFIVERRTILAMRTAVNI